MPWLPLADLPGDFDPCSSIRGFISRKTPLLPQALVLALRQLHEQWPTRGIEPGQQGFHLCFRHGRASDGWLPRTTPNMHEDTRPAGRKGRTCIVVHENAPTI